MAEESVASTISQHEPRRPKTSAERQRAYRQRKRQQRQLALSAVLPEAIAEALPYDQPVTSAAELRVTASVTPDVTSVTPVTPVTLTHVTPATLEVATPLTAHITHVTASHIDSSIKRPISSYALTAAALALACVGLTMNGWFARTLGSTELAGWLFLAVGVASDLVALAVPPTAIHLWRARQRATAAVAWLAWFVTFVFAVGSGIGFASVNIADATLSRGSRVTPAVTIAQDALRDAVASRNRECMSGVGRFCRERDQVVTERQRALDAALSAVEHSADPQTDAAIKVIAWISGGNAKPAADGVVILRLILVGLLPQIGGILLMIGRPR